MNKDYIIHITHDGGSYTSCPMSLKEAREVAEEENKKWVWRWHKHGNGSRPIVMIYKFVETFDKKVWGVDNFFS